MSTGILSNLSFVRRHALKTMALAILSAGVFVGGCGKLKQENADLRQQNVELKDQVAASQTEKAQLQTSLQTTEAEKNRLAGQLAATAAQPPMVPQDYPTQYPGKKGAHASRESSNERTVVLAGDTLFGSGSATLKPSAKKEIDGVLSQVKTAQHVRVEGYTDSDPVTKSHWKSNEALSKARAEAVTSYLVSKGVPKSKLTSIGKGAADPKSTKAESRRVEIVIAE